MLIRIGDIVEVIEENSAYNKGDKLTVTRFGDGANGKLLMNDYISTVIGLYEEDVILIKRGELIE